MATVWTELFTDLGTCLGGWNSRYIYDSYGIPKGAILYIVFRNGQDAADGMVGCRTYGSSLYRYLSIPEAEAGGGTHVGMYVKTDAALGMIELYGDGVCTARIMGYWTGVDFTEKWDQNYPSTANDWVTVTASTGGTGRVHSIVGQNVNQAGAQTLGARIQGSSLVRAISVHEAESFGGSAGSPMSMCVKSNASNQVQLYGSTSSYACYYFAGYFDASMDYAELAPTAASITTANTWTDFDATAYLDQDGRVVDTYCMHSATGVEYNVGSRKNGSALARYLLEHEAESNGNTGYGVPTETDTGGILEFYCGTASAEYVGIIGYYKPATIIDKVVTDSLSLSDVGVVDKSQRVVTETIGLLDFSLTFDDIYTHPQWTTSDYTKHYPCCYQVHCFRTRGASERVWFFCNDTRYFMHTSAPRFTGEIYTYSYWINDFGAGNADDRKDDVFWDKVNLKFRSAWMSGIYVYIQTGTPNQTANYYCSWSGNALAYTGTGEVQTEVCCAYADSKFWLGVLETTGGSGNYYPKIMSSTTWGSFGAKTVVDNGNGNCSAMRILDGGGSSMKTTILYVTGSAAGSYSIRGKSYDGGLISIGQICSDLYDPNTWCAGTDEKGNVHVVWAYGATGQGIKYVRIVNGTIGTVRTIATAASTWSNVKVSISVDKRCDRQIVSFSFIDSSNWAPARYVGMTQDAPYALVTTVNSLAGGAYWAYLSSDPDCGTYDVWVSVKHNSSANNVYLVKLPPVINKTGTDAEGLVDVVSVTMAFAKLVEDAIGLADLVLVGKSLTTTADVIGLVDAILSGKGLIETDSIGLVDAIDVVKALFVFITDTLGLTDQVAVQKFKTILDSISLMDAGTRNKALTILEDLYLGDVEYRGKAVVETDSINLTDTLLKLMTGLVIEAIGLSDSGLRNKPLIPITDSIVVDDQGLKTRHITISESIGMADGPKTDKDLTVASDSIALSDLSLTDKLLVLITDALALSDAKLVDKFAFIADTMQLLDTIIALVGKSVVIADNISLDDLDLTGKSTYVTDSISLSDLDLAGKALKIIEAMMLSDQELVNKALVLNEGIHLSSPRDYTDPDLVLAYNMETLTGGGLIKDLSDTGNDGTTQGNIRVGGVGGVIGSATEFDGVDDYVDVGNPIDLQTFTAISFGAWVKSTGGSSYSVRPGIIYKMDGYEPSGGFGWTIYDGSGCRFWLGTYPDDGQLNPGVMPNEWTHYTLTWDGANIYIYKNGNPVVGPVAYNGTVSTTTGRLNIGRNTSRGKYFIGEIDEVFIYDRALSPNEVKLLYEESVFRNKAVIILEATGLLDADLRPTRSFPISDDLLLATEVLALTKALLTQDNISLSEVVIRVRTGIMVLRRLRGELTAADVEGRTPPEQHIKGERRDEDLEGETEKKDAQGRETKKYWQRGLKE